MEKNKGMKMVRVIIMIIIIIIVGVLINKTNKKKNKDRQEEIDNMQSSIIKTENKESAVEKYIQTMQDGTKVNISTKLKEDKNVDNLVIKNIQLKYKDGVTNLLATVENKNGQKIEKTKVIIQLMDENGKEIYKLNGIIEETEAGKTAKLNCSITADYANVYDVKIVKK